MTDRNADPVEPTLFSAVLTPHRSLGPLGFILLMSFLSAVSFAAGMVFYLIGAWPIVGFLGLDVLLVYLAFRASYRAATAYETVTMTPSELSVRKISRHGAVRQAIAYISEHWREQPEIEEIAEAVGVTATELHHLFRRWAGLTPKAFLQAITLEHARKLLRASASVLDATYEVGLSGPGRLHDLFVTHEAMSPGEWKSGGQGLTIRYGFHPSPFGTALVMATDRGLAGLAFADPGEEEAALEDMRSRWPRAGYVEDAPTTAALARRIFDPKLWRPDRPLRIVLIGTDFELRVWETLLGIPMGSA